MFSSETIRGCNQFLLKSLTPYWRLQISCSELSYQVTKTAGLTFNSQNRSNPFQYLIKAGRRIDRPQVHLPWLLPLKTEDTKMSIMKGNFRIEGDIHFPVYTTSSSRPLCPAGHPEVPSHCPEPMLPGSRKTQSLMRSDYCQQVIMGPKSPLVPGEHPWHQQPGLR